MTVYARCVEYIGDRFSRNWYKVGKDYPIHGDPDGDFGIIDEEGTDMWCTWEDDPDCIWERVEY